MRSRALALLVALIASCAILFPMEAAAQGQTLYTDFGCAGCHSDPPDNLRRNTGGTRAVLDRAIAINAGGWMGRYASNTVEVANGTEPLTATQRNDIVAYLGTYVANATATVAYQGSTMVTLRDMQVAGSTVLTNVATSFLANGTLTGLDITPFGPPTISYNHTATNCNPGSFSYRGTGSANTTLRSASITVTPPAAPVANNSTSNIAYSTGATAIPLTLTGGPASSIVIDSQPSVGSVSPSGLNATYTASSTSYASTVTFTYRVVGPCSNSGTGTVTINVGAPPPPVVTNKSQTVQSNTTTNIDLTANISGIYSPPIAIASGPTNGMAVVSGTTVNYTPNTNYSGADSFTYTATGPGGTSVPATVSITITAAPLTANRSVTVTYQTATPIDLTSSITGPFTSVAVASPPANGTAMVTGPSTITYTPNAGYFGADSFTYTATGAGGTSTPATVSITVNPPPPTAANRSVTVPASTPTPIDLATSITGVSTSVSVATPPAQGTATVTGPTTITYTPTPGYVGTDSFTYTATGPGGTSAPATVSITVLPPPPPGSSPLSATVPYNTTTQINLFTALSGVFSAVTIVSQPAHGTVTWLGGTVVSYTPTAGYFGPDSFTFAGLGLGGASPTQTVSITVSPPGPPTVTARTVSVPYNTAVPIDLTGAVSGVFTSIAIATAPTRGTATISGNVVTYKPATNYTGADSFTFTATGPGGTSAPATVDLTVNTAPPIAANTTLAVAFDGSGTIDLAPFISGSGITGVSISTAPAHGTATVSGTRVTYTPARGFFGTDTFKYIAFGNAGTSPPATITVTIIGRPDPTKNPTVTGVIDAQNNVAQRFARAQLGNFQQRLEALHNREPAPASSAAAAAPRPALAARVAPEPAPAQQRPDPVLVASAGGSGLTGAIPSSTTSPLAAALANSFMSLASAQSLSVAAGHGASPFGGGVGVWVAGTLHFGNRDTNGPMRFRTDGVSAGIDKRFSERFAAGVGVGFARDRTDLADDGSKTRTDGTAFAAYASFHPSRNTFVDVLAGRANLDMDADRFIGMMGQFARSERKGEQWFGSIGAGYEHRIEGMMISPYARLDYASTRLKQATERGGGAGALIFFEQTVPMFQGAVGLRAESQHDTRFGSVRPRARIEFNHEFEDPRAASVAYADLFGTRYTITPAGSKRNALLLGIGGDFHLGGGLRFGVDYQTRRASHANVDQMIRLQITQELDGRGGAPRWFGASTPFEDPVRIEAGYMWEDNVSRARTERDKLADHVFSFSASKGRIFRFGPNTRLVGNLSVGGEEFYKYTGLGRFSGTLSAELQYRQSGDWDATTFGVQGRASGDYYDTPNRRGYKASVALTARRSLTDRIEAFAALTGSQRWGRSGVFDMKDYGAKFNVDYALSGPNGSLYLGGEYRKGDAVSSGRFALEAIDIADVFTPDEAFGPGFFAYRFDAKTWIGTLGYNRPLGPRDGIDISWRRAQSTPTGRPTFQVPGAFRYIDNQYSIVYLMRF